MRFLLSLALISTALLISIVPNLAAAHSGGLNAQGCHAGSKPYHCHRPQTLTAQNGPSVKMSRTDICHAQGSRYYFQTKNFTAFEDIATCIQAGGRLPK